MPYNVIFLTESHFPVRSRYVIYFTFSLTFKAFVMFVTFLLCQGNLDVVLALGNFRNLLTVKVIVGNRKPKFF